MFKFKRLQIVLHLLGWAILFCAPFIGRDSIHTSFLLKSIFHLVLLAGLFYTNMLLLIPRLLFEKKIGIYVSLLFLLVILVVITNYCFDHWFMDTHAMEFRHHPPGMHRKPPFGFRFFPSFLSTVFVAGISTSLKVIDEYLKKEKHQKEIENEKLNSELAFLRYQINPHFLFNTLNNLYSLAQTGSKNLDQAILKLSELMRYMLEENERNQVPLIKEIEYIQNYLELQRLRIHESVIINVTIQGLNTESRIEPLLLIPFIENAFKHGISYNQHSYISIEITITGNQLFLNVENSIPKVNSERDKASGIGLANVRQRLKLLYPDHHFLVIDSREDKFVVNLLIDL